MNKQVTFPSATVVQSYVNSGTAYIMVSTKNGNAMWVFGDDPDELVRVAKALGHTDIIVMKIERLQP